MNKNPIFTSIGTIPPYWLVQQSGVKKFFALMTTIVTFVLLGVLLSSCGIEIVGGGSSTPPPPPPPTQSPPNDRLYRFTGDPNKDSQTLGVTPNDLLQRAASGDGWLVAPVTFTVYYHTCIDMDAGLSDQDVQNRIHARIEWISHDISGVTRTFIAGKGTAQGRATIYSESSSCPRR